MGGERRRIDDIVRAVAEGRFVSWDEELRFISNDEERRLVEHLHVVETIANAHRGLPGPGTNLGEFEIIREIGRGAMGVVYEARQRPPLDRHVALKVLSAELTADAEALRRLESEAGTLGRLNHPNIVTIHSVEQSDGLHFINMELVSGSSLSERIPRHGMSADRLLDLAIPLADALSSAHEAGVVHRDLKPANIMVSNEGRLKVLDFGLAVLRSQRGSDDEAEKLAEDPDTTRQGVIAGTIPYMSPEQTRGRPLDHRSDLFALGTILYEMATGRRPFEKDTPRELLSAIRNDRPPPVSAIRPDLPADLSRMIAHCLRKDPEHRYQTAKGLRNELEELKMAPGPAPPVPPPRPVTPAVVATAVILLTLVAAPFVGKRIIGWINPPPTAARYLAVMPFATAGEQSEEIDAFGGGLAEILAAKLTELTRTHDLQVASTFAIEKYVKTWPPSFQQMSEGLGVNMAVTGSMLQSGDEVRTTVNLVEVPGQSILRARVIRTDVGDPFEFQDQIVGAVVEMLELELPALEEQALRAHGTDVAVAYDHYVQGKGYLKNYDRPENVDNAIAAFREALEVDSSYAEAHAALGMAYWRKYRTDQAPQWLELASESCARSIELNEDQAAGHTCLGTVHRETGRYAVAASEFGWAISKDPTSDEAFYGLGRTYESLRDPDAAEEVYRKALELRPQYWATHNWLGTFYQRQGRYDEAEEKFDRVVQLAPDSYRGYLNLGGANLMQGDYDEAVDALEHSIRLKPTARGYSNLATAYFSRRQFGHAVRLYEKAIEIGRMDFGVWGNLGEAYYWLSGQRERSREPYERAVELARQALEVNPDDALTLSELAKYLAMLGERDEALGALTRALEVNPSSPDLLFNAAVVHNQLKDARTAVDFLKESRANGMLPNWIRDNPVFDNLHGNEEFRRLIR